MNAYFCRACGTRFFPKDSDKVDTSSVCEGCDPKGFPTTPPPTEAEAKAGKGGK